VLANVKDITLKDAWDVLQESQRQLQVRGYSRLSPACKECHHGCKKVKRKVSVDGKTVDSYNYEFKKEFKGVGLNRGK